MVRHGVAPRTHGGREAAMGRRTEPLLSAHLADVTGEVQTCVTWLLSPVQARGLDDDQRREARSGWVDAVTAEWGPCGRVLRDTDGTLIGHVLYAPPSYLPGLASLPTAPASQDAVVMVELSTVAGQPRPALARHLVQSMAKDLVTREISAVEAFGQPIRTGDCGCLLSPGLLGALGFAVHRPHPLHPRFRMDLRRSVTWKDEVELAIERVLGAVRPAPSTKKATRPIRSARVASDDS
ncbi:MAG: GNAT family N-acetyltransferase [Nocardioides sp.]|uniref:GNAT family N-acetyltransferase n=1 Tax=Nocardioides sp. TaxID=35761 RepID=UPI003F0F4091